tara:strand:+ start:2362 stop:2856 length:495 start_codon:yes stop_codon:yes gene_type:complete
MATITAQVSTPRGASMRGRKPFMHETTLDFAAATASKGTALASADIFQVMTIPANHAILDAGIQVTTIHAGTSTDLAIDLGVTGIDADAFVDAFDMDAKAVGVYAVGAGNGAVAPQAAADTLDILFQAMTGSTTAGAVRVYAVLMDMSELGSVGAEEVDRDTLA